MGWQIGYQMQTLAHLCKDALFIILHTNCIESGNKANFKNLERTWKSRKTSKNIENPLKILETP